MIETVESGPSPSRTKPPLSSALVLMLPLLEPASAGEHPRGLDRCAGDGSAGLVDDLATERRCGGEGFSRRQLDDLRRFGDREVLPSLARHRDVRDGEKRND